MDKFKNLRKAKKPRQILKVTSSKYEGAKVVKDSKMYWNNILNSFPGTSVGPVSKMILFYHLFVLFYASPVQSLSFSI